MVHQDPSFTIGIEEEYLLIDNESRDLASDPPPGFLAACQEALGDKVAPEFLRCQVEVGTPVCRTMQETRQELAHLRATISACAKAYNMSPLAVSTHPFADWNKQRNTDKARYNELAKDLQVVVRRLLICGMHVHIGIEDKAIRHDIFSQITYFLPHLLALSTSSPYWVGKRTGLKSYRLSVFTELPRTGLPESFADYSEYERTLDVLIKTGMIEDASKVWWDLRPSQHYPTLELRITDVCTHIDDAIAIASLFRCLARMLYRLRRNNQRWRQYVNFLIAENRWLAQRHGVSGELIDYGKSQCVPFSDLVDEMLDLVAEDAAFFECEAELAHARTILTRGTSADQQIGIFEAAKAEGLDDRTAFNRVVDHLRAQTIADC